MRKSVLDFYNPFPKQAEFHREGAKYRLFGGAAGPGKTKALLWEAIRQANRYAGADTLLLRRTFPELETSLLREFRRGVPRDLYKSFNEQKKTVTWWNGSTTRFGHCASENDVYEYQGGEYLFIGPDELTHFSLKQWQFLTSRNRCPIPGTFPNMAGATNPGNIGHKWVKALWIDKRPPPGYERPEQYNPSDYAFIPALISDNPIYAKDQNYLATLDSLPGNLRNALLNGSWDSFEGQYFDIFLHSRHTARPEECRLESWIPRWISIDWGFEHPSAVYWHGTNRNGQHVTYREFVKNHLSPKQLGEAVAELSAGDDIEAVYLSPDTWAKRTSEDTIAAQLSDVLTANGLPAADKADDDRLGGWQLCYSLLEQDKCLISTACPRLIECIPSLVRDEKKVEDIAKVDGDDAADSWRYGLKTRIGEIQPPLEVRVQERMEKTPLMENGKVKDFTSYAIHAAKIQHEEQRKVQTVRFRRRRRGW